MNISNFKDTAIHVDNCFCIDCGIGCFSVVIYKHHTIGIDGCCFSRTAGGNVDSCGRINNGIGNDTVFCDNEVTFDLCPVGRTTIDTKSTTSQNNCIDG